MLWMGRGAVNAVHGKRSAPHGSVTGPPNLPAPAKASQLLAGHVPQFAFMKHQKH